MNRIELFIILGFIIFLCILLKYFINACKRRKNEISELLERLNKHEN